MLALTGNHGAFFDGAGWERHKKHKDDFTIYHEVVGYDANRYQVEDFHFFYICKEKIVFLPPLFVPKSERAEGGQQTYIKGVESTLYLRRTESRKFIVCCTVKQCSMPMVRVYFHNIHTAWASALLILNRQAMREPRTRDEQ